MESPRVASPARPDDRNEPDEPGRANPARPADRAPLADRADRADQANPADDDRPPSPSPNALPVVAVVVTHNPGDWFDDALAGLATQDYPALSVLVIDAGSETDPAPRVAASLPKAHVKRLADNPGYGAAANAALRMVRGAAFYLLCHDDVALAPDAIRLLVEEALRSNAGVVGPKLVEWDDPRRLAAVGLTVDKTGVPAPLVDAGELDQAQHDTVREVFAVPGGCMLVRADLFSTLEGFDPGISHLGEDLDLCWRAQVAGARVVVAPTATARHAETRGERRPSDDQRRLRARHRLRTMLTCYSGFHLLRVLPQAALIALAEAVYGLLTGGVRRAGDVLGAWVWNLVNLPGTLKRRRLVQSQRQAHDRALRKLQVRGSVRLGALVRGPGAAGISARSVAGAGRDLLESFQEGRVRTAVAVWVGVLAGVLIGARLFITDAVPAFGDLPALPDSPGDLFSEWASAWRASGLGGEAPAPTGLALLGLGGVATFAHMGLLRMLLVVGLLVAGPAGMWRLTRPLESIRARAVGLVVYTAIPVGYNAIATGRWGGLVMWAAAPYVMARLARATGRAPYRRLARRRTEILSLGLLTAVVAAFVPFAAVVVLVAAAGLVAGTVLVGTGRGSGRVVIDAVLAVGVAALLHLPWTIGLIRGLDWTAIGGVQGSDPLTWPDLLRFETGPFGGPPLGWAFLVAAALPLLIGRGWRLAWAARGWSVASLCWLVAWVGEQSWFPGNLSAPEALLAPAAVGLALATAIGPVAFEIDLPGANFGWRQLAAGAAAVAGIAGLVPLAIGVVNGRWQAPPEDFDSLLSFLDEEQSEGAFRVLWLGDADVIPVAGHEFHDGLAFGTSAGGLPSVRDHWVAADDEPLELVAESVEIAEARETSRLGRLLAPMGIRYVVVPEDAAPGQPGGYPVPDLVTVLAEQLDLERLDLDPELHVFENADWVSERAALPADSLPSGDERYVEAAHRAAMAGATPTLMRADGYAAWSGDVAAGEVYLSGTASDGWELEVATDGNATTAERRDAFGWANGFTVDEPGAATLRFRTPVSYRALLGVQVLLWLAVLLALRAAAVERRQREEEVT
ncbi:MAG: glycosyltransferase [Acidimicrobiales bacterium]